MQPSIKNKIDLKFQVFSLTSIADERKIVINVVVITFLNVRPIGYPIRVSKNKNKFPKATKTFL